VFSGGSLQDEGREEFIRADVVGSPGWPVVAFQVVGYIG
jgi:hypothetical protein